MRGAGAVQGPVEDCLQALIDEQGADEQGHQR